MRLDVEIGGEKHRIVVDGAHSVGYLVGMLSTRWKETHDGDSIFIKELRTADNVRLHVDDQIYDVLKESENIIAIQETALEDLRPGDMISNCLLRRIIGEGSYGKVYLAKDLNLNREVAVKILRANKANHLNTKRFLREAWLNGSLSSDPRVVTVYDFGRTKGGIPYIVMELLKGKPLDQDLDTRIEEDRPYTCLEVIQIIGPILLGLHSAHTHNPPIVHRDLKPDNIWLNSEEGAVTVSKLLDFGIAVPTNPDKETVPCGTRMYASPEQIRKGGEVDCRSDIWSAGVVIYQMLTLVTDVPFDPIEICAGRLTEVPDVMSGTRTKITRRFADIVMRALKIEKTERWNTAKDMFEALHRIELELQQPRVAL